MAERTRTWMRVRSPFERPPKRFITRSCASDPGSMAPPTSGTHSPTR